MRNSKEDELKDYKKELEEQLKEVEVLLKTNTKNLSKLKNLPEYGVKASTVRGCAQYYLVDSKTGERKYVKKGNKELVRKIAQRDYELAINKKLERLRDRLKRFVSNYDIKTIDALYENMSEARKALVLPLYETDELFIQRWREENPGNQNPYPDEAKYYTSQGDYVRSKSEKIIADLLDKYRVPYSYEPRLELNNRHVIYPDFVILNVRKRKTIYWEHLGLLGDVDYARKNFEKIAEYEDNGYNVGDNLLISMESEQRVFDAKIVEEKIKKYCM